MKLEHKRSQKCHPLQLKKQEVLFKIRCPIRRETVSPLLISLPDGGACVSCQDLSQRLLFLDSGWRNEVVCYPTPCWMLVIASNRLPSVCQPWRPRLICRTLWPFFHHLTDPCQLFYLQLFHHLRRILDVLEASLALQENHSGLLGHLPQLGTLIMRLDLELHKKVIYMMKPTMPTSFKSD